jgi:hypothetical protein
MNKHVLASVAVVAFMGGTSANAADLAIGPAYKAPIVTPIVSYGWTGFYAGLNAGGRLVMHPRIRASMPRTVTPRGDATRLSPFFRPGTT